ncbi:hypothetical protein [Candidatus Reidiella endopervernicosa]|nr:hypothetical protein [Candidatus Reidiella endopervernicosa]QKQ27453.1 hypothetical protein HUE57_15050 [Candidatus Reidiella endopervernicosa]
MIKTIFRLFVVGIIALGLVNPATAAKKPRYKPYVLASVSSGDMAAKVNEVRNKLKGGGFDLVGEYVPYDNAHVFVITNKAIIKAASKAKGGAYAAGQRVSVTKDGGKIQVAFFNPTYMAYAYRMSDDLQNTYKQLAKLLGKKEEFGSKRGLKKRKLKKYHYTFGMEYFDEPYELVSYGSQAEAVRAVEAGLAAKKAGVVKIGRIDIDGSGQTLFAVGLQAGTDNSDADDKSIMGVIDFGKLKHTAMLPYEILVKDGDVYALHGRFRIAMAFPDLSMMGDKSFMNIMASPNAIGAAFATVSGGDPSKYKK